MADNINVTPGAGATVSTGTRTIASTSVQVQRVDEQGGTGFATGQVVPTSTAATLIAARETRKSVIFINRGTVDVYIGPATVTTGNGWQLKPTETVEFRTTALVQAITAAGTGSVHYEEDYDA